MNTLIAYPAFKNRTTNPYQALLYQALVPLGWRVLEMDDARRRPWIRATVVHLHWPDGYAFRRSAIHTLLRALFLFALLRFWRMRGAKVIWTLHNMRSEEQLHPRIESWFWQRFYHSIDGWIALNGFSAETARGMPLLRELPHKVIPHGLYPRLADHPQIASTQSASPRRILVFGKIRQSRELAQLVESFAADPSRELDLTIAGRCSDPSYELWLQSRAAACPGLNFRPGFLADAELDAELRKADAVLIPYTGALNSGAVFLALAYGCPVIAPATPVFDELEADFGKQMVHQFGHPLTVEELLRIMPGCPPKQQLDPIPAATLQRYCWDCIAAEHAAFFGSW